MNLAVSQAVPFVETFADVATRTSLINRLRDVGDDNSWRTFFETYWRLINNVTRKSGLSAEEAEDVVQETVIAVARKMPGFCYDPSRGSFKHWLLLITRRRIQDHLRRKYRLASVTDPAADSSIHEQAASSSPPPDEQINAVWEQEWQANLLQLALSRVRHKVNPKHYQVFDYCAVQNLPAARVAKMLGLNAAQVYLAKHRIGAAVKREIQRLEKELP